MKIDKEKQEITEKIADLEAEILILKNEKEQLQEKYLSLEKIIADKGTAFISGNNKGQIINANAKALRLAEYTIEEICQKNIQDIFIQQEQSKTNSKQGTTGISKEQILLKKSGKKIFVSTRIQITTQGHYNILIKNINKRKKAEIALLDAQNRYHELAENINDVIWTATKNLKIAYISSSITKITGFSPDVYYLRPLKELMTPISYQLLIDTIKKEGDLLKLKNDSKKSYNISIEIKLFQKQYSSVWAELTASLILDHFGEIIGYQGIIRNIDAQKRTQEILEKSYQKYNFAIKSVGSGVWELNADLTRISVDENLLNILGYTKSEKKPFLNDWINLTFKEDRIFIIDILQDILDGKRFSASYDCRRIHKNDKILWFSDYVEAIYNSEGKIIELLGTSKNITNEKLTEEKKYRYYAGLQLLIESTFQFLKFSKPEPIYNYAGKILVQNIPNSLIVFSSVNYQTNEMRPVRFFGAHEQKLNKQLGNLSNNNDAVSVKINPKIQKLLDQKFLIECDTNDECITQIFNEEIKNAIQNSLKTFRLFIVGVGSEDHISDSISIFSKESTEIINKEFIEAFISLFAIILEKKKIELELKKTNETKDKFFSIISHDLKNPFNTLIGFSGLIIQNFEKITSQKILEFAKLIHDAALQSHEMMQNLFEWVNSQKGTMICRPVKIDINGLIESNIKLFSSEAIKKEIALEFNNGPETDFYADIDMLNTVIRNLISNALKFTNTGGKVTVSHELKDHEVLFSVIDNGVGIHDGKLKSIFKMSTNKSTVGTHMEKGTGLGLLLCEEFVNINGGKIWAESKQGKGSTFKFTIPLKK